MFQYCVGMLLKILQLNWSLHLAMIPPSVTQCCSEWLFRFYWPSPAPSCRQRTEFNTMKSMQRTYTSSTRQEYWLWLICTNMTVYWSTFNQTGYIRKKEQYRGKQPYFSFEPWINLSDRGSCISLRKCIPIYLYALLEYWLFSFTPGHIFARTSHRSDKYLLFITNREVKEQVRSSATLPLQSLSLFCSQIIWTNSIPVMRLTCNIWTWVLIAC